MRAETVIQTVKDVLKQPPAIAKDKVRGAVLWFVYSCVSEMTLGGKIFFVQCILLNRLQRWVHVFSLWPNKNAYQYLQWPPGMILAVASEAQFTAPSAPCVHLRQWVVQGQILRWGFSGRVEEKHRSQSPRSVYFSCCLFHSFLLLSLWNEGLMSVSSSHFAVTLVLGSVISWPCTTCATKKSMTKSLPSVVSG